MKKRIIFTILVLMLLLTSISLAWRETEISKKVPLPLKIQITPPDPGLPKEIATFSGRWEGTWEAVTATDSILIVEKIDQKKARVIYAVGPFLGTRGDYFHYSAKIIQGVKLKLEFWSQYSRFVFEIGEDLKTLNGTREAIDVRYQYKDKIKMEKIEEE